MPSSSTMSLSAFANKLRSRDEQLAELEDLRAKCAQRILSLETENFLKTQTIEDLQRHLAASERQCHTLQQKLDRTTTAEILVREELKRIQTPQLAAALTEAKNLVEEKYRVDEYHLSSLADVISASNGPDEFLSQVVACLARAKEAAGKHVHSFRAGVDVQELFFKSVDPPEHGGRSG